MRNAGATMTAEACVVCRKGVYFALLTNVISPGAGAVNRGHALDDAFPVADQFASEQGRKVLQLQSHRFSESFLARSRARPHGSGKT